MVISGIMGIFLGAIIGGGMIVLKLWWWDDMRKTFKMIGGPLDGQRIKMFRSCRSYHSPEGIYIRCGKVFVYTGEATINQ